MSGAAVLQEMIAAFQGLETFPAAVAREAAPELERTLKATASAGTSPSGQAWAPRRSGGRAMAGAAKAITAKAFGNVVRVVLTGVEVFHHFGKGKSEPRRPVIPDAGGELPGLVREVLERAAEKAFARVMSGAR